MGAAGDGLVPTAVDDTLGTPGSMTSSQPVGEEDHTPAEAAAPLSSAEGIADVANVDRGVLRPRWASAVRSSPGTVGRPVLENDRGDDASLTEGTLTPAVVVP